MSNLLPIIEDLDNARGDAERAAWLLSCPLQILGKYRDTIVNRLQHAGFHFGIEYLEAELAGLMAVRGRDGVPVGGPAETLVFARFAMQAIADRQAPDHSLTEV